MKALSIRQPWAWLILHAGKDIENRNWSTKFRGTVLIHASKGCTKAEFEDASEFAEDIGINIEMMPGWKQIERGGIVGSVEIVDCVDDSESKWFFGNYGFVLRNTKVLTFTPFVGALGFFDVPEIALVTHVKGGTA